MFSEMLSSFIFAPFALYQILKILPSPFHLPQTSARPGLHDGPVRIQTVPPSIYVENAGPLAHHLLHVLSHRSSIFFAKKLPFYAHFSINHFVL
jgi:hypothetical protein